jgi:hypothetical protein
MEKWAISFFSFLSLSLESQAMKYHTPPNERNDRLPAFGGKATTQMMP